MGKASVTAGAFIASKVRRLALREPKDRRIPERNLYERVHRYIQEAWVEDEDNDIDKNQFALDRTAEQGSKKTRGVWTRPNFSLVAIHSYPYIPGKTIEVITFEVKPADDFRIEGVYETEAHSRHAHRSYLMIHTPKGRPDINKFQRLVDECERLRLGLIIFKNPNDWKTYETVQKAVHNNPNPGDVNSFIENQMSKESQKRISGLKYAPKKGARAICAHPAAGNSR